MVSRILHLLIRHILWNQQRPLVEYSGDLSRCLNSLAEIPKLSHQLLDLNHRCELGPKYCHKILPSHGLNCLSSQGMSFIRQETSVTSAPSGQLLVRKALATSTNERLLMIGSVFLKNSEAAHAKNLQKVKVRVPMSQLAFSG